MVGMALGRYAEEWWRAVDPAHKNGRVLKPGFLASACWAAKERFDRGEKPCGPIGAMLVQLHWAGWTMITPTTFATKEGWEICLLVASPRAVLRVFSGDDTRNTEERASEVVKRVWGLQVELGREVWWEPLQKTLRSRKPTALMQASL